MNAKPESERAERLHITMPRRQATALWREALRRKVPTSRVVQEAVAFWLENGTLSDPTGNQGEECED